MKIAFVLEYSLGHATHAENLKRQLNDDSVVLPTYIDLDFHDQSDLYSRLPIVRSNWSFRASLRAYLALRSQERHFDAALFHTQVTSLFSVGLMRRIPSVVSLDATPLQYDALGDSYGHKPSNYALVEEIKRRLNQRAFARAQKLVAWSEWAKKSLVLNYGVPAEKVVVIPPGIDTQGQWQFPPRDLEGTAVRLLFVGGDFFRKGGKALLEAMEDPRVAALDVHLDIVTKTEGITSKLPHVTIHRGLKPNSSPLRDLFARASLFVFPTLGDCLPLAVMEALAAGLPVITTSVGALPEAVQHGDAGWIVPPNDPLALTEAIIGLGTDKLLRANMSRRARQVAEERFNAEINYRRLIDVVKSVATTTNNV